MSERAHDRHPWDLAKVPSAEAYREAIRQTRSVLKGTRYRQMLEAHHAARGHTITARELAKAVGFANFNRLTGSVDAAPTSNRRGAREDR